MNLTQSPQILLTDLQTLKQTSKTLFTQFQGSDISDLKPISYENSEIQIQSLTESRKSNFSDMNVYELLNKCDQFISQHSLQDPKTVKKSSINSLDGYFQSQLPKGCSQCKYHLMKELQWMKEKIRLEQKIEQLEKNLKEIVVVTELQNQRQFQKQALNEDLKRKYDLKLQLQVYQLQIKDDEEYGFLSQSPSPQTTSIIRSESQNQIFSQNEHLLESIKTVNDKLTESVTENKYLKIENRSLLKTKSQVQNIKKEIEKTKSQRDLFKKKLISLAEKQSRSKEKHEGQNEKLSTAGLKERGLQNKKKNDKLFELSLTDASFIRESQNSQNYVAKHFKKSQRVNFTSSFKPI